MCRQKLLQGLFLPKFASQAQKESLQTPAPSLLSCRLFSYRGQTKSKGKLKFRKLNPKREEELVEDTLQGVRLLQFFPDFRAGAGDIRKKTRTESIMAKRFFCLMSERSG